MPSDNNKSILQIIQKMVQDNEPEEKIISTLQSLGVTQDQAKRLLLIAQADTFTLLKSEIDKIVQERLEQKKKQIEEDTQKFINKEIEEKKKEIKEELDKEVLKQKLSLSAAQKTFQDSVSDSISKIAKLNEESYSMSEENKKMIQTVEKDLSETKLKGIKLRRSLVRNLLMLIGVTSFIGAAWIIISLTNTQFSVDYITTAIILALIGTSLLYLSANI